MFKVLGETVTLTVLQRVGDIDVRASGTSEGMIGAPKSTVERVGASDAPGGIVRALSMLVEIGIRASETPEEVCVRASVRPGEVLRASYAPVEVVRAPKMPVEVVRAPKTPVETGIRTSETSGAIVRAPETPGEVFRAPETPEDSFRAPETP